MIKQLTKSNPPIPHTCKTRMRYRGPIESIKINSFQQSLSKDIMELEQRLVHSHRSITQYATETFNGSKTKVEVMIGDAKVFECMDNVKQSVILSNPLKTSFAPDIATDDDGYFNGLI